MVNNKNFKGSSQNSALFQSLIFASIPTSNKKRDLKLVTKIFNYRLRFGII